jgi:hypothetical protein
LFGRHAGEQIAQEVGHRGRFGHQGTVAIPQVCAEYPTVAVEENVGKAVPASLKRPRARTPFVVPLGQLEFHRSIVAERGWCRRRAGGYIVDFAFRPGAGGGT